MGSPSEIDIKSINAIRGLAVDAVENADSGHPGLPMGAAPMAYALWSRHLRFDPKDPHWFNRDRFILSAGHGCMLQYALLHLTGYDLSMDDLKHFRMLHSRTPGHPENLITPGVEMATGPLGQGVGHSVGFAIAESHLAATFNKPGHAVIDHFTYVICSDGDMMEGISNEAASLAGHLKLGKLIWLYDDNTVTIDGHTNIAFTEAVETRFLGLGWHVLRVRQGEDFEAVDTAITEAKSVTGQPSLIICSTIIGFGSPHFAGTSRAHSDAFGPDEVKLIHLALGLPPESFGVPDEVYTNYHAIADNAAKAHTDWNAALDAYAGAYPEEASALKNAIAGDFGHKWIDALPSFTDKMATRKSGEAVVQAIAPFLTTLLGGSADLNASTFTKQKAYAEYQPQSPEGRNIEFGIREHAMAAAVNGITLHGGSKAYGSSFMVFTDYCRPSLRLAALQDAASIFVFTHDSLGVGQDGPTHEPIEQISSMRLIPNFNVIRPADGNETSAAWKVALQSKTNPTLLALTRQAVPQLTPANVKDHPLEKGAYVLSEASGGSPKLILIGTGSELQLCVGAKATLEAAGIPTRVVSFPSWFLFEKQPAEYRHSVLPKGVPTVAVEAGATAIWYKYSQAQVGIDRFGLSAPGDQVMAEFGFTVDNVVKTAKALLAG